MNMKKLKITKKELFVDYIPALCIAALIIVFAVWREQSFIKTLPTLITLVVMIMSVRANRFAFVVGASNSVLYAVAYLIEGLYFSAASALLVSMPIQVFSFFHWSRHKSGKTQAKLIRLNWWQLVLVIVGIFPLWAGCYFGLSPLIGGNMPLLDTLLFTLGIVISLLVAFRAIEGNYLNVLSCIISLVMWIMICIKDPSNINYIIISAYNLFKVIQGTVTWTMLYCKDNKQKKIGS